MGSPYLTLTYTYKIKNLLIRKSNIKEKKYINKYCTVPRTYYILNNKIKTEKKKTYRYRESLDGTKRNRDSTYRIEYSIYKQREIKI